MHSFRRHRYWGAVVFMAVFAVLGLSLLLLSHASTPYVSVETESGAIAGTAQAVTNDSAASSASGHSYVKFDSTSVSGGPLGISGTWSLKFDDEFNGNSLDLSKWVLCNPSFQNSCVPYNNEQELFNTALTGNPNVVEGNGILQLIATKGSNGQIYSGMISTGPNQFKANEPNFNSFQYTYGVYEARVKVPKGNGFWPSLWMLPDQTKYGAWPGSGEYDVFEIAGNDPTVVHMTEHDGNTGGNGDGATLTMADTSADYHTYSFDWEPDHLAWYIDGKLARSMICTTTYAAAHPGVCDSNLQNANAPITASSPIKNYPFYIIANFSVGGSWPPLKGAPDASTKFPASMDIDWIRAWQH